MEIIIIIITTLQYLVILWIISMVRGKHKRCFHTKSSCLVGVQLIIHLQVKLQMSQNDMGDLTKLDKTILQNYQKKNMSAKKSQYSVIVNQHPKLYCRPTCRNVTLLNGKGCIICFSQAWLFKFTTSWVRPAV